MRVLGSASLIGGADNHSDQSQHAAVGTARLAGHGDDEGDDDECHGLLLR